MKANFVLQELEKREKFGLANEVLNYFKKRTPPDLEVLKGLFGYEKAESIQSIIRTFFNENRIQNPVIRVHDYYAPQEIYIARSELEKDKDYQAVHIALLCNTIPDKKNLEKYYGNYTDAIMKIYGAFIDLQLKRKCDLTSAAHLNRVGGVCVKLKFDNAGKYEYGTLAAIHDAIEYLLPLLKNKKGEIYSIENYDEFLDDYIPAELQENVKILTNHYNLILEYIIDILRDEDKSINKKNTQRKYVDLKSNCKE